MNSLRNSGRSWKHLNLVCLLVTGSFCLGGLGPHTVLHVTVTLDPPCGCGECTGPPGHDFLFGKDGGRNTRQNSLRIVGRSWDL